MDDERRRWLERLLEASQRTIADLERTGRHRALLDPLGRLRDRLTAELGGDVDRRMLDGVRLDHSIVAVSDWAVSNRFYRDVVGAELVEVGDGRTSYRFNGTQLNVHGPGFFPSDNVARLPVRPGNSDLCFVWPGPVEGAVAHLAQQGVEIETGPVARVGAQGEGSSVYFRDPDGSLLEFISYQQHS
jgi:catechol 2,3-dioxygenase-like lactoylglutathione lyase family enzyme